MSNKSMGDRFLAQRRERAASSAPSTNLTLLSSATSTSGAAGGGSGVGGSSGSGGGSGRAVKSFAEIQQEQLRESQVKILKRPDAPSQSTLHSSTHSTHSTNSQHSIHSQSTQQARPRPSRKPQETGPIEQGVIHTLLDKFGFIHCANRPTELFFHYTSTKIRWDDLNIGDEVEFRVSMGGGDRRGGGSNNKRGGDDKLRAEEVRVLPANSVIWETEDEVGKRWRGKVDRVPRDKVLGILRGDGVEASFTDAKTRLGRGDIVEFSLFTECRTGNKVARDVVLIQSERERVREEKEQRLLEGATLERGVVVTDKGDYGFIKSVDRMDEVYFHVSNTEQGLKEGQEVEFYVVDESTLGGKKSSKSLSARKIKLLPKGSVKFEVVLAEGVTGVVVECPVEQGEAFGRGGKRGILLGKIRLDEPIKTEDGDEIVEVVLHPDVYPGGIYAMNRVGSEMGSWIRPGDVLLFDVTQQVRDGKCRAIPTKHTHIASLRSEEYTVDDSTKPVIRLVELSLMGRTEGIVRVIRDDYAFIHCAERNVDAYMKLYEVFPKEIYSDLMLNNPDLYSNENSVAQKGGRTPVEVGMEVSFDLSLQMLTNHVGSMGGRRPNNRATQEKESLRARRVQILPKGTVKEKILVATGVKATVTKEDKRQPLVGSLDLEESLTIQTSSLRYPYITKLLDYVSSGKYGNEALFHDVLSEKDVYSVTTMVDSRDELEWKYVALDGESVEDSHHRKLCIMRRSKDEAGNRESSMSADIASDKADNAEKEGANEAEAVETEAEVAPAEDATTNKTPSDSEKKKKSKVEKILKSLRYDKSSFPDTSIEPLGVGDVITCDLYLSRYGQVQVENISVIERKERPVPDTTQRIADGKENVRDMKNLTGYVTEVVPSRQFGFITGVDSNGSKTGDHVFFHYKVIASDEDTPQDASSSSPKAKRVTKSDIRKGDEVKFDAEPGKNGKLTATTIKILPRGTLKLPSKVDKSNSCTGYILLEPSHTSLANTPSHIVLHSGPSLDGAGRWDNVGKEPKTSNVSGSNIKEEGVILLLTDPSHLFSHKPGRKSSLNDSDETNNGKESSDDVPESKPDDAATVESAVGTHVRYKTSSLAYRGSSGDSDRPDGPKRGDLVVFGKTKGAKLVKDIRIEKLDAATMVKGVLVDFKVDDNTATFSSDNGTKYSISLSEVVSCEKTLLRENQEVNGILHEGKIFGVCRTKDVFLTSSLSKSSGGGNNGPKQRPKLNLTVKKELQGMGGQIMAQSKMAKGPDGTNGFAPGWTKRLSPYVKTFVPVNIPDSGFDSSHTEENVADE